MEEKILEICKSVNSSIDFSANDLVSSGTLSSVTMVEIISEIMGEFSIELPYEEIIPENFNSISDMAKLVEKYV